MVSSGHHIRSAGGDKQVKSAYCTGAYGRNSLTAREPIYLRKSIILRAVNRHSNPTRGPGHYNVRTPGIMLTASGLGITRRLGTKPGFPFAFSILRVD